MHTPSNRFSTGLGRSSHCFFFLSPCDWGCLVLSNVVSNIVEISWGISIKCACVHCTCLVEIVQYIEFSFILVFFSLRKITKMLMGNWHVCQFLLISKMRAKRLAYIYVGVYTQKQPLIIPVFHLQMSKMVECIYDLYPVQKDWLNLHEPNQLVL